MDEAGNDEGAVWESKQEAKRKMLDYLSSPVNKETEEAFESIEISNNDYE